MARQNHERQLKLEPLRINSAIEKITGLGFEITKRTSTSIQFVFKRETVTYYPYSGWASGKSIIDGRGFDHLIKNIDRKDSIVNNKDFYEHNDRNGNNERTKKRLRQLECLGLSEVGIASFGIEGVLSGVFIERVWSYNEKSWEGTIEWIKDLSN